MKIAFFFRKRHSGYNSIEEVFNTLIPKIESTYHASRVTVPFVSSAWGVIFNWLFASWRKVDIMHITGDIHYLALFRNSPVVITVHDLQSIFRSRGIGMRLKKWLWVTGPLKRAKRIVAISENTRQEISQMLPEVSHKVSVIPNPISSLFRFSPKKMNSEIPIILHVGTAAHKNLSKVVRAISGMEVELNILGVLSLEQEKLLKRTSIRYQSFSGLSYEDVYQLYLSADIVSFPSDYEGFGMPIIEAQASGRPVLTSNNPSIRQIAGEGGALFVDSNERELKNGFQELLSNSDLRDSLIEAGQTNVKRYEAGKVAEQYISLYQEVVNEP